MKQESQVSTEDDQVSYRDSLDLSNQSATNADPEQEADQEPENAEEAEPPALPDSGPPDDETEAEQELSASLAELNVNQSNNNFPCSPLISLSGRPLARLCGKKLPLTRNRDSEPEFVWYYHRNHCVWSLLELSDRNLFFYTLKYSKAWNWEGYCGVYKIKYEVFNLCSCVDLSSARLLLSDAITPVISEDLTHMIKNVFLCQFVF